MTLDRFEGPYSPDELMSLPFDSRSLQRAISGSRAEEDLLEYMGREKFSN